MESKSKLLKQQEALDESIEIWESYKDFNNYGNTDCPCCEIADENCNGCPIFEFTGDENCYNTPFYDTRYWHYLVKRNKSKKNRKNYLRKVQEELHFLKQVRRNLNNVSE